MNNFFSPAFQLTTRIRRLISMLAKPGFSEIKGYKFDLAEFTVDSPERVIGEWVNHLLIHKSKHTVKAYLQSVLPILEQFSDIAVVTWGAEQISFLQSLDTNPRTTRHRLAVCRSLIRFCEKKSGQPCPHWKAWFAARPALRIRNVNVLTLGQLNALMLKLHQRRYRGEAFVIAVLLAAFWGLRAAEIASLSFGDVLIAGSITLVVRGKGGKQREVPAVCVPAKAHEHIARWWSLANHGNLAAPFIGLSESKIQRVVARALDRIGVSVANSVGEKADSLHHLRHWYANRLHQHGVPLSDIARLLGHRSPTTTTGSYMHFQKHGAITPSTGMQAEMSLVTLAEWCGTSLKHMRHQFRRAQIAGVRNTVPLGEIIEHMDTLLQAHTVSSVS